MCADDGRAGRNVVHHHRVRADARRAEVARRIGFDSYGVVRDMPDPVATAINGMLDHIHATDERLEHLCRAVRALGADVPDAKLPDLDEPDLS